MRRIRFFLTNIENSQQKGGQTFNCLPLIVRVEYYHS